MKIEDRMQDVPYSFSKKHDKTLTGEAIADAFKEALFRFREQQEKNPKIKWESKEKTLEWAKILEKYGLARIDYPTFKDPVLILEEKEKIVLVSGKENKLKNETIKR